MASLALPKGSSLEQRTLELFVAAGLEPRRPSTRTYRARIDYHGSIEVAFYKPREIPLVVADGHFDFGLTGVDWIEEAGVQVETVESLHYAKTSDSWRLVLAVPAGHPANRLADLGAGLRVATEYPNISRAYFREHGLAVEVVRSYGATEAKIPELADAIVDVAETGAALRHNGLRIIETVRTCVPHLIANPAAYRDARKRATIEGVARLLRAVRSASGQVLLTVRTRPGQLPRVASVMPPRSWRAGTGLADDEIVLQGLADRCRLAGTIDLLMDAGASDIVETDLVRLVTGEGSPGSRTG